MAKAMRGLSGAAPGLITYAEIEVFGYEATDGDDVIDILSTALGTTYLIVGNGGSDTFTVGTDLGSFDTGVGSLAAILGPITLVADFNGPAGLADTLNVDDSGDPDADLAASITDAAGGLLLARTTTLAGFAPVPIAYEYTPGLAATEFVNIRAAQGGNTIYVGATTASIATTVDSGIGDDANTITIVGDNLSGDNLFTGNLGNDQFVLEITADLGAAAIFPITGLEIRGDDPAADSSNRDGLHVVDLGGGARTLAFVYQPGDGLDLFGFAVPIVIRSMETLHYKGDAANDDAVTVIGTPDDDDLTVAPQDGSTALVFVGGDPWDGPAAEGDFFDQYPGVAGLSNGPDVLIRGISPAGLTVHGWGGTSDTVYVYAPSEEPLVDPATLVDPFGFGLGVIVPGFGVGGAYDQIAMSDAGVQIINSAAGMLVPINLVTASLVQGNPLDFGLVVNVGFETAPDVTGIADDIVAALSANFAMLVNGGDPDPNADPFDNIPPEGDRLSVLTPDDVTVYSTKAVNPGDPPIVVITSGPLLGLAFSSIENITLTPGNASQTVNLVGDNNDPAVDQSDNFVVIGADVDSLLPPIPGAQEEFQPDLFLP